MDQFAAYGHAIASVVIWAVMAQILNAATGIRKGAANLAPGDTHKADYENAAYRLDRAYMNTVETLAFYAAIVVAAVLAGANPFWINLLATWALVLRIAANVVYLRGIGQAYGGLRTQMMIGVSLCNILMAVLAVAALF